MKEFILLGCFFMTANAMAQDTRGRPPASGCEAKIQKGDIVMLGDSISVMPYGSEIAKAIKGGSSTQVVARFAVGGSAAVHWVKGFKAGFFRHTNTVCESRAGLAQPAVAGQQIPDFASIKAAGEPGAVVIALGTNDLNNYCTSVKQGGDKAGAMWMNGARDLANAAGASCIWILPLTYTTGEIAAACEALPGGMRGAISKLENEVKGKCRTVNTSSFCNMPLLDKAGIHPSSNAEAVKLGACVGKQVKAVLGR